MKIALIVSLLVTSLALNAQMLQGKVVRVADGDMITILDGARGKSLMAHSHFLATSGVAFLLRAHATKDIWPSPFHSAIKI